MFTNIMCCGNYITALVTKMLVISVFLKVFRRVLWWRFRVSTRFSYLCLIFLTDFHEMQVSVNIHLVLTEKETESN